MSHEKQSYTDDDDKFFLIVAKELAIGRKDEALWARAFAENDGDNTKTKASYIRMRVSRLRTSDAKKPEPAFEAAIVTQSEPTVTASKPTRTGDTLSEPRIEKAAELEAQDTSLSAITPKETQGSALSGWILPTLGGVIVAKLISPLGAIVTFAAYTALKNKLSKWAAGSISIVAGVITGGIASLLVLPALNGERAPHENPYVQFVTPNQKDSQQAQASAPVDWSKFTPVPETTNQNSDSGWTQENTKSKQLGPWMDYWPTGERYCTMADGFIYRLYPPGVRSDLPTANRFCLAESRIPADWSKYTAVNETSAK